MGFLKRFTINQKIWIGFSLGLLLFIGNAIYSLMAYNALEKPLTEIVTRNQPVVMAALDLRYEMEESSTAMSLYLLTQEPQYKTLYLTTLEWLEQNAQKLREQMQQNSELKSVLDSIISDIAIYKGYKDRMVELAEQQRRNFPAFEIAINEMNPIGDQLRSLAAQMATDIKDESDDNALITDLYELRYAWVSVMLQIRGYLGYRDRASEQNLWHYLDKVKTQLERLKSYDTMPFIVQDSLEQFDKLFASFHAPLQRMMDVHGSEQWRTDAFILRSDLGPLQNQIEARLDYLVETLRDDINQISHHTHSQAVTKKRIIIVISVIGVGLGILIAFSITYLIRCRLSELRDAMNDVVEGGSTLTQRLDETGSDEMATLASSFNKFVTKIKGVIDLVTQCSTGLARGRSHVTNYQQDNRWRSPSTT